MVAKSEPPCPRLPALGLDEPIRCEALRCTCTVRCCVVRQKVAERQATLQALEDQISALVDQRTALEAGQFAGIVTLYQNMKRDMALQVVKHQREKR